MAHSARPVDRRLALGSSRPPADGGWRATGTHTRPRRHLPVAAAVLSGHLPAGRTLAVSDHGHWR